MKLKIKDDVKLNLLEELGFEKENNTYSYYYEPSDCYIFIKDNQKELTLSRPTCLSDYNYNEAYEFEIKLLIPPIIFILIKLDLIEIIY